MLQLKDVVIRASAPWAELGLDPKSKSNQLCPIHNGNSLSICTQEDGAILWYCRNSACNSNAGAKKGGTIIEMLLHLGAHRSRQDAMRAVALEHLGYTDDQLASELETVREPKKPDYLMSGPDPTPWPDLALPTSAYTGTGARLTLINDEVLVGQTKHKVNLDIASPTHAWQAWGRYGGKRITICVLRWDVEIPETGKRHKVVRPFSMEQGQPWRLGIPKVRKRPIYKLAQIASSNITTPIYIVEGETSMDALQLLLDDAAVLGNAPHAIVTTTIGGSGAALDTDLTCLNGRDVTYVPDCDAPGLHYIKSIHENIKAKSSRLIWVSDVQETGNGYDVKDWCDEGHSYSDFTSLGATPMGGDIGLQQLISRASSASAQDVSSILDDAISGYMGDTLVMEQIKDALVRSTKLTRPTLTKLLRERTNEAQKKMRLVELGLHDLDDVGSSSYEDVYSRAMMMAHGDVLRCINKSWWNYNGIIWHEMNEDLLWHRMDDLMKQHYKEPKDYHKTWEASMRMLKRRAAPKAHEKCMPRFIGDKDRVINATNCEILVKDDGRIERRQHKAEHGLIRGIGCEYNPDATCPIYDKMVREIFCGDQGLVDTWHEIAGYLIQPTRPLKHFFIFQGTGNNGKTTLMRVMVAICGDSVSHKRITDISDRFGLGDMLGKLIILDDDVGSETKLDDGMLKKLSEAKIVNIERKYRDSTPVELIASPVMLCNQLPYTSDVTPATLSRAVVMPFRASFDNSVKDPTLVGKIKSGELSGVLNHFVQGLVRVTKRGFINMPKIVDEAKLEWISESASLPYFMRHYIEEAPGESISMNSLHEAYMWMLTNDLASTTDKISSKLNLKRKFTSAGYHFQDAHTRDGRSKLVNVRLVDYAPK